ncbi:MAG: hypothetical protein LBM23_06230 [Propionibacteriaceae bacterium]|jgi:hypothetical protein|nr:hypothetical protein [Propionibacteriaceae bacterium]
MDLADEVLPLIRTRNELWRWSAANAHGVRMHEGIDRLEAALGVEDPAVVYDVTKRAIASAYKVIARADDSSGLIGFACRRLLDLHPRAAALAKPPARKLVDWMMGINFHEEVDYFEIDPVAYALALEDKGMAFYREALALKAESLGPRPDPSKRWNSEHSREWFVIDYNDQRLAVLDRDIDRIVETHLRDGKVAAWYKDTAEALAEIGEWTLAIDWAHKGATEFTGHQAEESAHYWCDLLEQHQPDEVLGARIEVFDRWPTAQNAESLHQAAGDAWPDHEPDVMEKLSVRPEEAVSFAQNGLKDIRLAWELAHDLTLTSSHQWQALAKAYQKIDPVATLPIHRDLVEEELDTAGANHYRRAARRLVTMRKLAAGSDHADEVDDYILELREIHRRRPRLQQEFDRAGLP